MINSGKLYGVGYQAVPTPEMILREERGHRIRSHAFEFVDATIPGLRECIDTQVHDLCNKPEPDEACAVHQDGRRAREWLDRITDLFVRFATDDDTRPVPERAEEIERSYEQFDSACRALGDALNRRESLAGFLKYHLEREVRKVADYLRDRPVSDYLRDRRPADEL